MELIDANALKDALEKRISERHESNKNATTLIDIAWDSGMSCAFNIINKQPIINAIPIQWIEEFTSKNPLYQADDLDWYIRDMIYDYMDNQKNKNE